MTGRMSVPETCDRFDFEFGEDEGEDKDTIGGHVTARSVAWQSAETRCKSAPLSQPF